MLTLLTTMLVAAPLQLDALGFSVEVSAREVVVLDVTPSSAAAAGGLVPGLRVDRVAQPAWPFLRGGRLTGASADDVRDALTPAHGEQLVLEVSTKAGQKKTLRLTRTDPPPARPFSQVLLPAQVARLSPARRALYFTLLPGLQSAQAAAAQPAGGPTLTFSAPKPEARVSEEGVQGVVGGAWSPAWVYATGKLAWDCEGRSLDSVEAADGEPLAKVVVPRTERSRGEAEVTVPLWRTKAVTARCGPGAPSDVVLPATIVLELRCAGLAMKRVELEASLSVACVEPRPAPLFDPLRVSPRWAQVGKPARVTLDFVLPTLRPRAVQLDVLELGPKTRPRASLSLERGLSKLDLELDTSQAGAVTFVPVVRFADGSREFGRPRRVAVGTQPFDDPLALVGQEKKLEALRRELATRRACTTPTAVAWLAAQPGVTESERLRDSVSFTFEGLPLVVQCPE